MCLMLSMKDKCREPFEEEGECEAKRWRGFRSGDGLTEGCKTLRVLFSKAEGKLPGGPGEDGKVRHGCKLLEQR